MPTSLFFRSCASAVLGAALLTGCQSDVAASLPASSGPYAYRLAPLPAEVVADPAARAEMASAARAAGEAVGRALHDASDWRTAVAAARALPAEHPDLPADVLRQLSSARLLDAYLTPASSPDMQRAALVEAEALVRLSSPEAGLIASALEAGRSVEPVRVAELARQYLPTAESALARQTDCDDCDAEAVEARLGTASGLTNAEETREAVVRLRDLAGS